MGSKAVDWEFVSDLGKRLQRSADDTLPDASRKCADAQTTMMDAGQGGGLLVVMSFFFAAAFLEDSLERKQTVAGELNRGAQACSRNWEATEKVNSFHVGGN
ncbi:hypothetical protein ACWDWO_24780 [Actinopolymorpha singaporensis]|uniref:Uncharacterized protein n=2 Tax=Actinopolymorpha TaxID=117156 RepID=A0A1H1MPL7_9ACTN|nr:MULTISPECIES: hypothetical protein [Actinopolymorpha]NYH87706.1 hypothetical protein [Actinopolymorpha rutila]SDR88677.1 hypothetical protein SAMN04489717_0909 [Actinopolymorpha singaporensis]